MKVLHDIDAARRAVRDEQQAGHTVGLVPTMGALHEGHVSLIRAARSQCDTVAVTIFVNPLQFGPGEDLDSYPKTLDSDLGTCRACGVAVVFAPSSETMYPGETTTKIHVNRLTEGLCGELRPGHFDGVTTVVAKLFQILPANKAFFGEKDFQQLVVIRRMVDDLNMPIEIVACPTVRHPDGLAMSSRNANLSPKERSQALSLSKSLFCAADRVKLGEDRTGPLVDKIRSTIMAAGPAIIDYVKIVDAHTLESLETIDRPARICLAVRIGSCRLIDNVGIDAPPS